MMEDLRTSVGSLAMKRESEQDISMDSGHSAQLFASCLVNVEVAGEEEMDDIVDVGGKGPGQEMGQNTVEPQGRVKSDKREKNRKISSGLQGQRSYSSVKYQVAV